MNLSPEIIKMREALLERIGDKSLKEVAQIVNEILLNETDSTNRLAALAARVKVLRNYINKNYEIKNKPKKSGLNNIKESDQPIKEASYNTAKNEDEKWVRVEMLKSGVVNGVRFPEGVVIDVNKNDADKLEENELAKIIDAPKTKEEEEVEAKEKEKVEAKEDKEVEAKEEGEVEAKEEEEVEAKEKEKVEAKEEEEVEAKEEEEVEAKEKEKVEAKRKDKVEENLKIDEITKDNKLDEQSDKKIIKTKSTKITEETIELTDPKAVAEALGLNDKKKKEEEPKEIEEEIDIEAIETGKKK